MKTIAVVCEKGGVGKTMIARELAFSFERQGIPCSFYSLDGQYEGATKKVDNAQVAIVDTPGSVMNNDVKQVVKNADAIVVPVRPTTNDIEPFMRTRAMIAGLSSLEPLIVVNGTNRWRMCRDFMQWLYGKDWALHVVEIPQTEAIVQALCQRKSAVEVDKGNVRLAVMRMVRETQRLAGLPMEAMPTPQRTLKQ